MRNHLVKVFSASFGAAVMVAVPGAAGASVAAKNQCKYVTVTEVSKALGQPVEQGPNPSGAASCVYTPKDNALPAFVNVQVESGSDAKILYTVTKQTYASNLEKAPGLGKKSFYAGGGINTAYAQKGSAVIVVKYVNANIDPSEIKPAVLAVAKLVRAHT
jgi:hypothetical protein